MNAPVERIGDATTSQVEPFPTEVLPSALAAFVREAAAALPCPPDLIAVPLLVFLGAAIGMSRVLEVKSNWTESARIYAAVVARSGTKKSPALALAAKPFSDRQAQLQSEYEHAIAPGEVTEEALRNADDKGQPLPPKQVLTTDSTVEALAVLLQQNLRGLIMVCDELVGWAKSMNQYRQGKGADRQAWLSFWSGALVAVNRKSSSAPIILPRPFVNVVGGLPPDILKDLCDEGGREDGFIQRILFSFPEEVELRWTEAAVSDEALKGYQTVIDQLWQLEASSDEFGCPIPNIVHFTPDGRLAFVEWVNQLFSELNEGSFPPQLRGAFAKMEGYCARLALILHLSRYVCREADSEAVDAFSVRGAIALVNYFKNHARKVYGRMDVPKNVADALDWIRKRGGKASVRDFVTNKVAGCTTHLAAEKFFVELRDMGYGTIGWTTPKRGGRTTMSFHLVTDLQSAITAD